MEVVDAIKNRYSVRGFLNKEVEKDTVKKIIELAKMAPSGVNCQPWKIYVVMGDARDSLVAEALSKVDAGKMDKEEYAVYPSERPDWYKARQRAAGFGLYKALGIERDDMAGRLEQGRKNYEFFGAPVGIFITVNKALGSNGWGYVGHMVQTLCLAAVNEGLGTCLQEAWAAFPQLVRKHVDYGDDEILWCGIALGHPDEKHPANSFRTDREDFDNYAKIIE